MFSAQGVLNKKKWNPMYFLRPRGKNSRIPYLIQSYFETKIPKSILQKRKRKLKKRYCNSSAKEEYIQHRVDYYCPLEASCHLHDAMFFSEMNSFQNNYYRDLFHIARYMPDNSRIHFVTGDNRRQFARPVVAKSRVIDSTNDSVTLLKLDRIRHFTFIKDKKTFERKKNRAIFRGGMYQSNRVAFMHKFFGHSRIHCGHTGHVGSDIPQRWHVGLMSLYKESFTSYSLRLRSI